MSDAVGQEELDKIRELVDKARGPLDFVGGWVDQLKREMEKMRAKIERLQGELTKASRANYESMRAKDRRIAELEHQLNHDLHAKGRLASIKALSEALTKAERERDDAYNRSAKNGELAQKLYSAELEAKRREMAAKGRVSQLEKQLDFSEKERREQAKEIEKQAILLDNQRATIEARDARIAALEKLCRQWRLGFALEDIRAGDMVDVEVDAVGWRVTVRPAKAGV